MCALLSWGSNDTNIHHEKTVGISSRMVWLTFCYRTLSPTIHMDSTLSYTSYLIIIEDQVHSSVGIVFYDEISIFQQDNTPCYTLHRFYRNGQKSRKKHHNPIEHLWDSLDQQFHSAGLSPYQSIAVKDLLIYWHQIPEKILGSFRVHILSGESYIWSTNI